MSLLGMIRVHGAVNAAMQAVDNGEEEITHDEFTAMLKALCTAVGVSAHRVALDSLSFYDRDGEYIQLLGPGEEWCNDC